MGKCLIRHTNKAVFISEVVMSYFFGRNGLKNATLIPNGVDTNVFFPADEKKRFAIRQELGLSDTKPLFLFVGRFVEKKGLHILRELASQFSSVNWIFAGWGRDLDPENWKLSNVTVFHGRS